MPLSSLGGWQLSQEVREGGGVEIRGESVQKEGTARPLWPEQREQGESRERSRGPLRAVTVADSYSRGRGIHGRVFSPGVKGFDSPAA